MPMEGIANDVELQTDQSETQQRHESCPGDRVGFEWVGVNPRLTESKIKALGVEPEAFFYEHIPNDRFDSLTG